MKSIQSLDHLLSKRGGPATVRRLRWIDARLHWVGEMTRGDLIRRFSISPSQASADLATYREIAPGNLLLDHADKRIKAGPGFEPIFEPDAQAWLEEEREAGAPDLPEFVRANDPWAVVPPDVLREVMRAASTRACVSVVYVSVSSGKVGRRTLAPHAIIDVGDRLHARAFDHARGGFADFVLARMSDPHAEPEAPWVDAAADVAWREPVELDLVPRQADLSAEVRAATLVELGLSEEGGRMAVRRALAFYTMERFGVIERSPSRVTCRNADRLPDDLKMIGRQDL